MRHIFISPHMDDAALSAVDYILELKRKKERIFIITVFTEFGKEPISVKSRKYLYDSGFFSLKKFAQQRKKEDRLAMKRLDVKYCHLGFIDAGFRKRKNVALLFKLFSYLGIGKRFVYPTKAALFSGKISPEDNSLFKKIYLKLKTTIKKNDILYGPIGAGNHPDHLIVKKVLFRFPNQKYYWLDQPYASQKKNQSQLKNLLKNYKKAFGIEQNKEKIKIIRCYSSQIKSLFKDKIKVKREIFYEEKN